MCTINIKILLNYLPIDICPLYMVGYRFQLDICSAVHYILCTNAQPWIYTRCSRYPGTGRQISGSGKIRKNQFAEKKARRVSI